MTKPGFYLPRPHRLCASCGVRIGYTGRYCVRAQCQRLAAKLRRAKSAEAVKR
jgi:hypothetical protein